MQKELIQTGGKMKAIRERVESQPHLDVSPDQDANSADRDAAEQALLTQRLQEQYGHDQVTDAISGEDTSPMGTLILAEWALGTAGLDSLVDGEGGSAQQVFSTLHSDDWAATSAAVLSRYETSHQPGHAHLAAELIRRSRGQRLPADVAARLSAALGADISDAVIHTDSAAAQAAAAVNAHAFATGKDVFFGQNKYRPGTREGDELLAHELTHVVQDAEGRIPAASGQGLTVSSPSDAHEREAETVAHDAMDILYGTSEIGLGIDTEASNVAYEETATATLSANDATLNRSETDETDSLSGTEEEEDVNYENIAHRIRNAIVGLGTDEAAIYSALSELNGDPYKVVQLKAAYENLFGTSLDEDFEGDLSGYELDHANELAEQEKATFLSPEKYGPVDIAHNRAVDNGIGGFEASFLPMEKKLVIRVSGKVQFKDAVTGSHPSFSTEHSELQNLSLLLGIIPADLAARILPYFQWNDEDKQEKLEMYKQRVSESIDIWENTGLHFGLDDPEWSEITAKLQVKLEVTEEGTAGNDQHLQVSIYKEPSDAEKAEIDRLLIEAGEGSLATNLADPGIRANAGVNLGSNSPTWPTGSTSTDANPMQNEMSLSSSDLYATPNDGQRGGHNHLLKSVMFDSGQHTLRTDQITHIQAFVSRYSDGDSIAENNAITLRGFASSSGSTEFNRELTERRLAAVHDALTSGGIPSTRITTENRSDIEAKSDAVGSDGASQANEQRVEVRIGTGERQNTVAHEFGHVFGLSDEYTEHSAHRHAGDHAWHSGTASNAGVSGGAMVEENDNIISVGNEVRPQHYSTFAWALNKLTESTRGTRLWHVKE